MRRYITLAVSLLFVYTATAWNKFGQQSIATLAEQNLTESAKAQTTQILGGSLSSAAWWLQSVAKEPEYQHTNSWQFIHLTKELKSTTTSTEDGVVQIERCVDILKHRSQHSDSTVVVTLKTLIHLVADMGSLSAPLYKWAVPDYYMTREQHNRLVQLNDKCMARAGFRLAALLNDIFR